MINVDENIFSGTPDEMTKVQDEVCKKWAELILDNLVTGVEKIEISDLKGNVIPEEEAEHHKHWTLSTMLMNTGAMILGMGLCHAKLHFTDEDEGLDKHYFDIEKAVFKQVMDVQKSMYEASMEDIKNHGQS